jgi:hypothetical protein
MIGQPALPTQDLPRPATHPRDDHNALLDALLEALRTDAPPLWSNIAAERALCPPVLWRSVSHGTKSPGGSRFVATILSVVATAASRGGMCWST